jgi:L-seryl-tRNA(Ser) seleniumtransferase
MSDRRTFFQRLAAVPLFLRGGSALAAPAPAKHDYFSELGVRTFINAAGTYTALSGSMMQPEVLAAIQYAAQHYVPLNELQDKVGERIASHLGCEFAMVTSGAAGALFCGTSACITGTDPKAILQIPDLTGLKSEVLVQKTHRYGYDHSVRATGVRMVEVESAEELERAKSEKTAMMLFWADAEPRGKINAPDFVALGKKLGVPTFADAADVLPPVDNLTRYLKLGFDLVAFSGGKGIRGPQSAGLLLGRKDLIRAARMNTSPNSDTIARSNKVNKEEVLGMLVALEGYLKRDHAAEWKEWERRVKVIADAARKVQSVETETIVPPVANHVPHLSIRWNQSKIALNGTEAMARLRAGSPSIEACPMTTPEALVIGVWMMKQGDAEVVARRVREVLSA